MTCGLKKACDSVRRLADDNEGKQLNFRTSERLEISVTTAVEITVSAELLEYRASLTTGRMNARRDRRGIRRKNLRENFRRNDRCIADRICVKIRAKDAQKYALKRAQKIRI